MFHSPQYYGKFYVGFQFLKPSHYQSAFVAKRDGFEENILSANVHEEEIIDNSNAADQKSLSLYAQRPPSKNKVRSKAQEKESHFMLYQCMEYLSYMAGVKTWLKQ